MFLRGFQTLMRCIMDGMDQQEQFAASYRKPRKFRSCSYCGRLHPCRCTEFIPWSRQFARPWISQLLHIVVDALVVQVEQVHFPVVTQRPFPWSSLSSRPLRFAVAVRVGWSLSQLCGLSCCLGAVVQETVEILQLPCCGVGLTGIF